MTLKMHEEVLCRFSVVSCPHCNLLMSAADLRDQHDCPKQLVQCKLCNEWVENQNLAEHDKHCSLATTRLCPKGCGQYIPIKLLVDHKLHHCEEREIKCEKCLTPMKAKELGRHLLHHCTKRNGECPMCGMFMPVSELPYHKENLCLKREVECRFGCKIIAEDLEKHEMSHLQKEFREWTTPEFLWWLDLTYFNDGFHRFVDIVRIRDLIVNEGINGKHLVKIWGSKFKKLFNQILSKSELSHLSKHLMHIKCSCPKRLRGDYISWRFD